MPSIRIMQAPQDTSLLGLRQEWVGVTIRLPSEEELTAISLSSLKIGVETEKHFTVLRSVAIAALRAAGKVATARVFEDPRGQRFLRFPKELCEKVA